MNVFVGTAGWAASTPESFRFSVKLSRYFTQETRLRDPGRLRGTLSAVASLGKKWGCLLVQLPPSLGFEKDAARDFIRALRDLYDGPMLWEPRHESWAGDAAVELLVSHGVDKVLADPERCPWPPDRRDELVRYHRLHGTPEIYKSRYDDAFIRDLAAGLARDTDGAIQTWVIFDNTVDGYATENALELAEILLGPEQDSFVEGPRV